jgi:hypothetical protein
MGVPIKRHLLMLGGGLAALLLLGCQNDEIKRYQAPKDETRRYVAPKRAIKPIACSAPQSWEKREPKTTVGEWRSFEVVEGGKTVKINIAGVRGGLLANLTRWHGQVNLGPVDEAQLQKELHETEVDGLPAYSVDLVGPEQPGQPRQRILGIIVEGANQDWFIKMMGPADLVEKQKPAFEAFVKSVRFGGTGANDE